MDIVQIFEPDQKEQITLKIMQALPEWFSPPEDILKKAKIHRDYPFFAAMDGENAVGFLALKIHNEYTADIFNLGVLKSHHRQKLGHRLVAAALDYCAKQNFVYLTVKTLDASADYAPYDSIRSFYLKEGFLPLEVFTTFWDEENPCLFLVRPVQNPKEN